jgi:hypothetical protein
MTLLTYTLAPDVPSSPVRSRHAPWVGHAVSAIAVVAAGLLGALAGVLIGLVAGILLAGAGGHTADDARWGGAQHHLTGVASGCKGRARRPIAADRPRADVSRISQKSHRRGENGLQ